MPFPSVDQHSGRVEIGLWCRGCAEQTVRIRGQAARDGHSLDIADCLELERRERKAFYGRGDLASLSDVLRCKEHLDPSQRRSWELKVDDL